MRPPVAHIGHYWASLLYAVPFAVLLLWLGCSRIVRWWRGRRGQ